MKLFWKELKLKFNEQLRVVGKFDLNKTNEYLVKRRKFKDVDLTKDFEKRLNLKRIEDEMDIFEEESKDLDNMNLNELELYREKIKNKEEEDKKSDLYQKIVLRDINKMAVLSLIRTHEFFDKNFEDCQLHPEMRKNLEIIEHNIKYNLPVEKRILFEAMPEMFTNEIGQLTHDERQRFRKRRFEISTTDNIITTGEKYQMALINQSYESDKVLEMTMYLFEQRREFLKKNEIFLNQAKKWGWDDIGEYLYAITRKDKIALTTIEANMLEELQEFDQIEEEILTLEDHLRNKEPELALPFPVDEKYKQELISQINHIKKFQTINIYDTSLIPIAIPEETFMDRLYKIPGVDIDEEIRISEEKYLKTINSGLPIRKRDPSIKDPELVRQINIVSQAVKVESPHKHQIGKYEMPLDYIEEGMLGQTPTDGRILIEEYYKVLYLNNEDPETYNFSYWEKYFGVSKITLRNIFNYIFFPIPDEKNPSEVGKILYFKDIEFEKKRKMIAEMTGEEYKEYLEKTHERPELEEFNRLDYLTYQTTATEPRITERTIPTDDQEIDERLNRPLINSEIIKEIDERIQTIVKEELENSGNTSLIERDIQIQLEEIKNKRFKLQSEEKKLLEDSSIAPFSNEKIKLYLKKNDEKVLVPHGTTDKEEKVEIVNEKEKESI